MINTNSGKQDDVTKDVAGDIVKNVSGDLIKEVGGFISVGRDFIVNPGPSSLTSSSSNICMIKTNSGKQDGVVKDVAGNLVKQDDSGNQDDVVKDVVGDLVKQESGKQEDVVKDVADDLLKNVAGVMNKARGCGLPGVLIGVLIVGVLIAVVFIFIHIKLSHDGKVACKVAGKVPVNAYLSATADNNNCSWRSPSGDFAFGFRQLENNDLFLLCIWFAKIPDRTIVWYANGDKPAPKGSTVKLTAKSGLVLTSPQGEQLWNQTIAGVVAHGVMYDTGNFVLIDDKSESLWETFKNPTDTMLPGQIIERGGKLSSRQSETNYARGRFQLDFQQDGNLVFSDKTPFCSTRTTIGNVTGSEGQQLVFDDSGNFYIMRNNTGKFKFTAEEYPAWDNYLRSTLNFEGVLAQYYLPKSSEGVSWKALWSEPHKVDSGAGDCWDNCSNCYLNVTPILICECPRG